MKKTSNVNFQGNFLLKAAAATYSEMPIPSQLHEKKKTIETCFSFSFCPGYFSSEIHDYKNSQ